MSESDLLVSESDLPVQVLALQVLVSDLLVSESDLPVQVSGLQVSDLPAQVLALQESDLPAPDPLILNQNHRNR